MTMLRYKISVSSDLSVGSVAGFNAHGWSTPPAPPIPTVPTVDYPAPAFWPPGAALGHNELTRAITHRRASVVQDGHDIGTMIPHLSTPIVNALTPVHVLFSRRKATFFETKVRFEKRFATACSALAWPPTPMMSCNDPVSMPIASMVTSPLLNSVEFGMSVSSYLFSYAAMAASVVLDAALKGKGTASAPRSIRSLWSQDAREQLAGGSGPTHIMAKIGLEASVGLGKLGTTSGPRTVTVSTPGSPLVSMSVSGDGSGGVSVKEVLGGLSPSTGGNAWTDAWRRMGHDGPWGAHLG